MKRVLLQHGSRGFVTLAVVIALLWVGSSATAFVLMLSWQADTGAELNRSGVQARWLADACADHGLSEVRFVPGYTGSESLSFGEGRCSIQGVTNVSSTSFELRAQGESGEAFARTLVVFELSSDASGAADGLMVASRSRVAAF
jgi:hypothetical protein